MEYLCNEFIKTYRERKNEDILCFDYFVFLYLYIFHLYEKNIETLDENWDEKESTGLNLGWDEYIVECVVNGEGLVVQTSFVFIVIALNIFFYLIVIQLLITQFGEIHNQNQNFGPWIVHKAATKRLHTRALTWHHPTWPVNMIL